MNLQILFLFGVAEDLFSQIVGFSMLALVGLLCIFLVGWEFLT
jgi:hypothetical protein